MGNRVSGEMWVIAVLPEFEGMGIGKELLRLVEDRMFAEGCTELRLTTDTDPSLRAYGFYLSQGWHETKESDGLKYMGKTRALQ